MNVDRADFSRRAQPELASRARLAFAFFAAALLASCNSVEAPAIKIKASEPTVAAPRAPLVNPASAERKRLIELFGGEYLSLIHI